MAETSRTTRFCIRNLSIRNRRLKLAKIKEHLRHMGRLSLESTLEKTGVVRNYLSGRSPSSNFWLSGVFDGGSRVETGRTWYFGRPSSCTRFLLLLKASRISGNIQAESRKFVSYKTYIQWHFTDRIKTNLYLNKNYCWEVSF